MGEWQHDVSNLSGHNGPGGPCDHLVKCECIGVMRDEAGKPIGLLFESPDAGPAGPDGALSGSPPIKFLFPAGCDECAPGPTQTIDPANPPDGVTFADPDNPTADELAAAAAALLDGTTPGTKAKFGDEPCQWIYEAAPDGEVCLLSKPWLQRTAEIYMGNTGIDILPTHDENTDFFPIGCMTFELPCAQEVVFEGYGHFRTDLDDIAGSASQSFTMIDIDGGGPVSMGHVTIHDRTVGGEQHSPYLYKAFLAAGTHTVCFEERLNYSDTVPFTSNHKVDYNQFKMIAKWVE